MTAGMDRIGIYRAAFRQILRHEGLDSEERIRALVTLAGHARRERYAELIVRVMLSELEWSIDRDDVEAERTVGEPLERRHRQLRVEGHNSCPRCLSPLSNDTDWRYWRALRESAIREAEARERAIA
jgi:hypothetical protein